MMLLSRHQPAAPGLPESVFALEMIDFLVEFVITGIIFGLIPTLYFVPMLYGKIEPLMGIKPRTAGKNDSMFDVPMGIIGSGILAIIKERLNEYKPSHGKLTMPVK
ncbi:MAG: hypothetical protein QME46_06355 [Thermoanaerobacteraceae bacterium]|nr:hypothetical protein [Thermoanaerobacteraceae bacterium]